MPIALIAGTCGYHAGPLPESEDPTLRFELREVNDVAVPEYVTDWAGRRETEIATSLHRCVSKRDGEMGEVW